MRNQPLSHDPLAYSLIGTVIALAWVGQRDTRWLIPLTVSVVTRVRKVTTFTGATGTSHDSSAFYFVYCHCHPVIVA